MPPQEFASYEDFFTFYLHEHSDARNRAMHAVGHFAGAWYADCGFCHRPPMVRIAVAGDFLCFCLDRPLPDRRQQAGDLWTSVLVADQ